MRTTARHATTRYPAAALLAAALAANAAGQTIDTVAELAVEANFFSAPRGFSGVESLALISADSPLGSFTHDFAQLGETQWTITWRAPAGQAIEIQPPSGFEDIDVEFFFRGGSGSSPGSTSGGDPAPIVDLLPGSPALPLINAQYILSGTGGDLVQALVRVDDPAVGEIYRFTSITLTFSVDAGFDATMDSPLFRVELAGVARTETGSPADPGQWIRLVPAPALCPGDVDGDDDTDVFDFSTLAANFGAGPDATRDQGDLTGDGFIDVFDFAELASDFGCDSD